MTTSNNTIVNHKTFGIGTIISNDGTFIKVDFNGEVKSMMIKYAGLTLTDGTIVPVKKTAKTVKSSYSFKELCKEDKDFLIRTGVVDINGNHVDTIVDSLIKTKEESITGEWA